MIYSVLDIRIYSTLFSYIYTAAKFSIDAINNPALKVKSFDLFCNKNSVILCTYNGATYHRTLYLENEL